MGTESSNIRKKHLTIRNSMPSNAVDDFSDLISENLGPFIGDIIGDIDDVLCYYPLGNEVNCFPVYKKLLEMGKNLYFPVTQGEDMTFYSVNSLVDGFVVGNFNVMEPSDLTMPFVDGSRAVCITPGVVFDVICDRIGFGGGYYDKFFAKNTNLIKVGVAYSNQIEMALPTHSLDVPLDFVVTDNCIYKRG